MIAKEAHPSEISLKVSFYGEFFRLFVKPDGPIVFSDIDRAIAQLVKGGLKNRRARYLDDEGDRCVLCPSTFEDFLLCSRRRCPGELILRLTLDETCTPLPDPAEKKRAHQKVAKQDEMRQLNAGQEEKHHAMGREGFQQGQLAEGNNSSAGGGGQSELLAGDGSESSDGSFEILEHVSVTGLATAS